ncbi:DNA repair protein recA homolog 1, chloroplastic-like [Gastrolobium bilobum]|uniref:DNA repair protein recA homolog 1, chloroplastic-like n=1 Tax=Gastrolobium bilobum TaxID=150636 RepID=UPI002AB2A959|nr:DNA repair protein recA homolog 1, chloroplastic-like [Gastrolobium bilobum]
MMDIVLKKGSWYSYGDHRLGQGRDKAIQYLKENTHLLEEIEKVVRSSLIDGTSLTSLAYTKNSPALRQDDDIFEESQG